MRRVGFALGVLLVFLIAMPPAVASSTTLFTLHDSRLDEASGIARGITSPGVYYVQNDSGDSARFFAVDAHTGRVRAEFDVPGAVNHDWEDLAVAPDSRGVPSVWLADIGDNDAKRDEVQLYRVDEPHVDLSRSGVVTQSAAPDVWRLRYPSGPVNAESLAVSPHGRAYLVTKADDGHSVLYSVPRSPDAEQVQTVKRIGAITFHPQASLIPDDLQVLATGAALSRDGTTLAIRTYTDAYVWPVRGGDIAAAVRTKPKRINLPLQPQGEGVCIVGNSLVLDSERTDSAVYRVTLPGFHRARPSPSTSSSSVAPVTPPSSRAAAAGKHKGTAPVLIGAIAIGGFVLVALWVIRRRARG